MTELLDTNVDDFAGKLHGGVTRPGDSDYDEARALYNAMIDKKPALIARCADVDEEQCRIWTVLERCHCYGGGRIRTSVG